MAQTWNNVLSYIKFELGGKLNIIEYSDDELIEGFKEHVVPYFSQYVPCTKELLLTGHDRVPTRPGENVWKYKIPIPLGEYIIDIKDVIATFTSGPNTSDDDPYYGTKFSRSNIRGNISSYGDAGLGIPFGSMAQTVIDNQYMDMMDYLSVKNTWEFTPPNMLAFDNQLSTATVIYDTIHTDLHSIQPDYFNTVFKDLCLVKAIEWIIALRTKYESLSTPVAEIKLNWQQLESKAERKRQEINDKLSAVPLDKFIEIC